MGYDSGIYVPASGGGGGGVAGSGTLNYVAKWTPDGATIGNSQIFDNGTFVGVNLNTGLSSVLQIKGKANDFTTYSLIVQNSDNYQSLKVSDDGSVYNLGAGSGNAQNTAYGVAGLLANTTGYDNTVYGFNAGATNITGIENTYIGSGAGLHATGASARTFVGKDAGLYNTGDSNTGVGYHALRASSGFGNTAVGQLCLVSTGTGYNNTGIGLDCLNQNSTGYLNSGIGLDCLYYNNGNNNTGAGAGAGYHCNTNAVGNTFIGAYSAKGLGGNFDTPLDNNQYNTYVGHLSGYSIISNTSNNVFLGAYSGYYETGSSKLFIDNAQRASEADGRIKALAYGIFDAAVANQRLTINGNLGIQGAQLASTSLTVSGLGNDNTTNTAIFRNLSGAVSLQILNDGSVFNNGLGANFNNTAFGQNALITNTSGDSNAGFGTYALWKTTSGNNNTATGWGALAQNITGANNTAFGFQSCLTATNVSGNSGFGYLTLNVATNGGNSAFGYISCYQVTSGQSNTGLGYATLQALKTGSFNTAAGTNCLQACLGSDNTAMGYYTLGNLTSGSKNTAIGENAGFTLTTTDRGVFVGYSAGYFETAANKLFIHCDSGSISNESDGRLQSLIYGIFGNGAVNQTLSLNAAIINLAYLQTGDGGLTTGQVYVDTAANILTNSDKIVAWKV